MMYYTNKKSVKSVLTVFTDLPTHTHYRMKHRKTGTSRMMKESSKVENLACQECKLNKNRFTPVKLESKKQAKKVVVQREGFSFHRSLGYGHVPVDKDFLSLSFASE